MDELWRARKAVTVLQSKDFAEKVKSEIFTRNKKPNHGKLVVIVFKNKQIKNTLY